jgi:hypothetical protein
MRATALLPLAIAVAAGCGHDQAQQVPPSVPRRDLALPAPAGEVKVASPVELAQLRIHRTSHSFRRAKRPAPAEPKITLAAVAPAPAPTILHPVPLVESVTPAKPNDRELAPGQTVTVIPASNGPVADGGRGDDFPVVIGRMGGGGSGMGGGGSGMGGGRNCPGGGRGPDIGIAGVPGPDFRIR